MNSTRRPLSTGIFSATRLLQKKYGVGEIRTHDLLAEKQKKIQAPARARTHDLVSARRTHYPLGRGDQNME